MKLIKCELALSDEDEWCMHENVYPQDGQLVVVINRYGNRAPEIMQWRKSDEINWLEPGYFLCVSEKWRFDNIGHADEEWDPWFQEMKNITAWMPLTLPKHEEVRILKEIESWFEEEEEG